MITNKKIINENIVCTYDSSNILASKYDSTSKKLIITFNRGAQYEYSDVTDSEYKVFEEAKSQGVEFNKTIKAKPFIKTNDVDPKIILDEMEKSNKIIMGQTELSRPEKQLITIIEAFLIFHQNKTELNLSELTDLKYFVDKVIESKRKH